MSAPLVHFVYPLDDFDEFEVKCKGWHGGAVAELPNGSLYPLTFYDPAHLAQTVASGAEAGEPCVGEVALVVVPELSKEAMRASVRWLYEQGWFDHLAPSTAKTPWQALGLEAPP